MQKKPNPFLALSTFLGTVIGVGVFGLPAVAAHMGFFPFLGLVLLLVGVLMTLHLQYTELVFGTEERHRTPGYIIEYLGKRWRPFTFGIAVLSLNGALVAYCIVGSTFLRLLFSHSFDLPFMTALAVFVILGGLIIGRGARGVAKVDLMLLGVFAVIIFSFLFVAAPRTVSEHYTTVNFGALPQGFGVVLFALWGLSSVPALADVAQRDRRLVRAVITTGIGCAALLYILFVFSVVGVNGAATSSDALTGFLAVLGPRWILTVGLLGFATTLTAFITLGSILKSTFVLDLKLPSWLGFCAVTTIPFAIVASGVTSFTTVLGVTGSFLLGIEALLVLSAVERQRRQKNAATRIRPLTWFLRTFLLLGMALELWHVLTAALR